ncbi:MAG: hypothetical protein ACFB0C_08940 [Leptolyngbyaceae cyanobacterium]
MQNQLHLDPVGPDLPPNPPVWSRVARSWKIWSVVTVVLFGGIAGASAISLFRIPNLPNCRAIFWPTASAATRLQCAEAYADQGDVDSLLAAIALVDALPEDHPMRVEMNGMIEAWAEQILNIAERTFHEGDLNQAIQMAQRIPTSTAVAAVVSDRVQAWEQIWQEATDIFERAEGHLEDSDFREAFSEAIRLRTVGNDYWATVKYEELTGLISATRQDLNTLGQARRLLRRGASADVLEALELAQSISTESPLYGDSQLLLKEIGQELLVLAELALDRADSDRALEILGKIPPEANLAAEVADFHTLAEAYELTWSDSAAAYEAAIVRLQSIGRDRPLYSRAQALMQQWRQDIQGLAQLDWARRIAAAGTVHDLRAAIAEARTISADSPRWGEAQDQIRQWQREISRIEDGPILDQARALARGGDRAGLSAAINTAGNVDSSSALYDEAQDLIADWRWTLQRMDNGPILDQARQLANSGNIAAAIATARQIPAGQALHSDAQNLIAGWEGQVRQTQSRQGLQQAYDLAQTGTAAALNQAIALALDVPESSDRWSEAQSAANQWSWEILAQAEAEANRDRSLAIQLAQQVPARTEAYAAAQLRIQEWRELDKPSE